eukprot:42645-Amphidinium_carterae.1
MPECLTAHQWNTMCNWAPRNGRRWARETVCCSRPLSAAAFCSSNLQRERVSDMSKANSRNPTAQFPGELLNCIRSRAQLDSVKDFQSRWPTLLCWSPGPHPVGNDASHMQVQPPVGQTTRIME